MKINGACHCGAVRFTAEIDPAAVKICHCADCQVISGAPFRAIVPAPLETFHLTGETKSYVKVAQSGNRRSQVFCPACGSALYGGAAENPTTAVIRLGCVEQRHLLAPKMQTWQSSAMPWLADLDAVPGDP